MRKLFIILVLFLFVVESNSQPYYWSHRVNGQSVSSSLFVSFIKATQVRATITIPANSGFRIIETGCLLIQGSGTPTFANAIDNIFYTLTDAGSEGNRFYGLNPETLYSARVYVLRTDGLYYGDIDEFTTDPDTGENPPTVVTNTTTNIDLTTATGNGNVTDAGSAAVTERGHVWATHNDPTTSDNKVISGSGTGSYSTSLTGLPCGLIYVRAYATNIYDTSYGEVNDFYTDASGLSTILVGVNVVTSVCGTVEIVDSLSAVQACSDFNNVACGGSRVLNGFVKRAVDLAEGEQLHEPSDNCSEDSYTNGFYVAKILGESIEYVVNIQNGIFQSVTLCN